MQNLVASTSKQAIRCFATSSVCHAGPSRAARPTSSTASTSKSTTNASTRGDVKTSLQSTIAAVTGGIESDNLLTSAAAAAPSFGTLERLQVDQVISPGMLTPHYLTEPAFLRPRPDLQKAFPLGPPVSRAKDDPFIRYGLDPLGSPMNYHLRSAFTTSMGKIKPRGKTQLQRSTQRKMAKAVRRARSMGILPVFGNPGR